MIVHVSGQHEQLSNPPCQTQAPFNQRSACSTKIQQPGILARRSVQNFGTTSIQTQSAHVSTGNSTSGITPPPSLYEAFILPEHRLLAVSSSERSTSEKTVVKRFSSPPSTVMAGLNASNVPTRQSGPAASEELERKIENRNVVGSYNTHGPRQQIEPSPGNGVAAVGPQLAVSVAASASIAENLLSQISQAGPSDPKKLYRPPQAIQTDANLRKSYSSVQHITTTCKANIVSNRAHVHATLMTQRPQSRSPREVRSQHNAHIPEKKQLQEKKDKAPQINNCSVGTTPSPYVIRSFHEMLPDSYPSVRHRSYRNESQVCSRASMSRNSRISRASHLDGMQSSKQDTQTQHQSPAASYVCCPSNSTYKRVAENQIEEQIYGGGSVCQQGAQWFPNCDSLPQQSTLVADDLQLCQTGVSSAPSVATPRNENHQFGPAPQLKRSGRWRCSDQTIPFRQEETKDLETAAFVSQEGQPVQTPEERHFPYLREILMKRSVPSRYPTYDGAHTCAGLLSGAQNGSYHSQNSNSSQMQDCSHQTKHGVSQGMDDVSAGEEQQRRQLAWQEQHQQRAHFFQPPSARDNNGQNETHPLPLKKIKPDLEYNIHGPSSGFPQGPSVPLSSNHSCDLGNAQDSRRYRRPSCHVSAQRGETNDTDSRKRSSQTQQDVRPDQVSRGHEMHSTHFNWRGHCETNTAGPTQIASKNRPQVLQAAKPCQVGLHHGQTTSGVYPVSETVQIVNPRSVVSDVKPAESPNLATNSTPHEKYRGRHSSGPSPTQRRQSQFNPRSVDKTSQIETHKRSTEQRIETFNNERETRHAAIKPVLTAEQCKNGIVLSWDLESRKFMSYILKYELFVNSVSADLAKLHTWERLGIVDALDLPMACTLSQFVPGASYHFAVRAVNISGQFELFSQPCSITITWPVKLFSSFPFGLKKRKLVEVGRRRCGFQRVKGARCCCRDSKQSGFQNKRQDD